MNSAEKSPYAGVYNLELWHMIQHQRHVQDQAHEENDDIAYAKAESKIASMRAELKRRGELK